MKNLIAACAALAILLGLGVAYAQEASAPDLPLAAVDQGVDTTTVGAETGVDLAAAEAGTDDMLVKIDGKKTGGDDDDEGCSCRISSDGSTGSLLLLAMGLVLLAWRRRR